MRNSRKDSGIATHTRIHFIISLSVLNADRNIALPRYAILRILTPATRNTDIST